MAIAIVSPDNLEYFKGKQDAYNDGKFAKKADVPKNVSELANDAGYQKASDVQGLINAAVASVVTWKGTKETVAELPSSGNKLGDVWHVNENGGEYAWNGSQWEQLGNSSGISIEWSAINGKPSVFPPETHTHTVSQISDFPESMPASDVSSWAKQPSKPTYTADEVGAAPASHTHAVATSQAAGFMSAADKSKLDGLDEAVAMTTEEIDEMFESA